jgi:hypothetical protein
MNDADNTDRALTSALRALAREDAGRATLLETSGAVEARLRVEVRAIGTARRARLRWRAGAAILGLAGLAAAAIPAWRFAGRSQETSTARVSPIATVAGTSPAPATQPRGEITTAFLPLVYGDVPAAGVQIVRLSVPRSALASFGLAPRESASTQDTTTAASSAPGDTVVADILVGDDGLARAVRFVRAMEPTVPTVPTARMEHTR